MGRLDIEKVGGLAGFGGHLKSRGSQDFEALSAADQAAVQRLFSGDAPKADPATRDGFTYRITHQTASGPRTVEAPEALVPEALKRVVKDTLG